MPSLRSITLREQIRFIKPLTSKMDIKTARAGQDAFGALGASANARKLNFSTVTFGIFKARYITRRENANNKVILYLHGGAYTAGDIKYACGFGSILCARTGADVMCPAYRLAPEHPFPAALRDAVASYEYLLDEGNDPENISFVGESAGGGLIFAVALELKATGLPLPHKMVAISPWADLTFSGKSYEVNRDADPSLSEDLLRQYAVMYAGDDTENPLVSPIFGDLSELPPSLIIAGGDELLLSDAQNLARRIVSSGGRCELIIEDGMWHVFPLFSCPEADDAIEKIHKFLEMPNGC
ncbi:MAG TPA: alpha/beta hydrolase [Oscillospiraceae bacterium]|nr:alpha/beta hydrolase [Oscillospiraceae bacterium]HPS34047.1 alpha/beta hydrolase [Oscillospiraceae bacterium]